MKRTVVSLLALLVVLLSAVAVQATVPAGNLLVNPTFVDGEKTIPPPGWTVYSELAANRRLSIINANNPAQRALLVEDDAAATGKDGEIGITQTINAGPGRYQAELKVRGVDSSTGTVYLQVRYLPSGVRKQVSFLVEKLPQHEFESILVDEVAPAGTTQVTVYLYTGQSVTPTMAVQSFSLVRLGN